MKILSISSYGGLGGSESTFAAFLAHRPSGVHTDVLLVSGGALETQLASADLHVRVARGGHGRPTPSMLARFHRELSAVLREQRYDAVWAMGQKAALLAASACRRRRVPLVWHKVDFSWDRLLARPLAAASSGVVVVSEAVAEALGQWRRRRPIEVVGPPVRLNREIPPLEPRPPPAIGTLGRLVPYKGHHLIIEAAALLRKRFPDVSVVLAGADSPPYPAYPARLRGVADELGIADAVELPGHADPSDVLERITVYVNATYRDEEGFGLEGLSGAMLEASLAGRPVVATRGGGTAEGVVHGETGTLVEEASPAALAAAIEPYLADGARAAAAGEAGRRLVRERFSPQVVSARLWRFLARIAQRAASSS